MHQPSPEGPGDSGGWNRRAAVSAPYLTPLKTLMSPSASPRIRPAVVVAIGASACRAAADRGSPVATSAPAPAASVRSTARRAMPSGLR